MGPSLGGIATKAMNGHNAIAKPCKQTLSGWVGTAEQEPPRILRSGSLLNVNGCICGLGGIKNGQRHCQRAIQWYIGSLACTLASDPRQHRGRYDMGKV